MAQHRRSESQMEALRRMESLRDSLIERQRSAAEIAAGVITLETEDPESAARETVAVGYGLERDGSYTVQLRVRSGTGPAYQQALDLESEARNQGYNTNLVVIQEASTPTLQQIRNSKPHPMMLDPARPLHLGVSVGHERGKPGSLAAFVTAGGKLGVMSASHVLARSGIANLGDPVHRPGLGDIKALGPRTKLGKLANFSIITDAASNSIDAAYAIISTEYQGIVPKYGLNIIPKHFSKCPIAGQKLDQVGDTRTDVIVGTRVGKIGRTTGYTEGLITAVGLFEITITNNAVLGRNIKFSDVLEISWDILTSPPETHLREESALTSMPFSGPGDSGSLVFTLDPPQAIGIHIAGGRRSDGTGVSYACNLAAALDYLGCGLASA